ncbi:glycoside hydrolase family 97 protein [Sandaracinobacter neustonicus]|uniref:Glycoside hydrolase family 97 protein n=1 Tax=Sandaracinobacter neustonicus TaxID=1715348 RepID=A0A501XEY6_9SPHN|nr:glycoside hydrolase family 97 protein [Sandaracinobacter neustonicus]TPE59132.1 glycoside hydrolase family 97 protein [Sandaracinobacter neustonicus]
MRNLIWLLAGLFLLGAARAEATPETLLSPSGHLSFTIDTDGDGRPLWSLAREGGAVVNPSRLGFILGDAPKLERNFEIVEAVRSSADSRWEQPWGERRFVTDRHNELLVMLREKTPLKRLLRLRVRLFDDGLGFRIEFPEQPNLKTARIVEELTEFDLAQPGTAWWIPGGQWNRYEYLYNRTPIAEVGQAHTPITFRDNAGLHLAIHEAALLDYAGMWLQRVEGQRFRSQLSPSGTGPAVVRDLPFATPWRVMLVAPDAAKLYAASDLILNLNEPSKLPDIGRWFTPHKYVGVWWEMHLDKSSWATGPKLGATTENTRRYIDFAAANGFRSVLVEGWNPGWDGDWFGTGDAFIFTRPTPWFDLEGLSAYARRKGVRIMGHHETAGNIKVYEAQLAPALDLYARLGVDSVKTGYVADAGGIQAADGSFQWHDGQVMSRHHLKVVEEAATRRIAVNPHEPIKDTGLRRTWPNWVSREGARGMEYNAWGDPKNPPDHEINLIFTRMLSGPMDYTPGILSLKGKGGTPIPSTMARQLALYVLIYSPIQMAADLPENYARHPGPFRFIRDVPADWDETRMLAGEVGEYALIARKDRNSQDWYVGGGTDEQPHELELPLGFLKDGRRYEAQIYADGPAADFRTEGRSDIAISKRVVTSADRIAVRMGAGGGVAIRFRAL